MSDRLAGLLHRFELKCRVFYTGNLCSLSNFDAQPGIGHLHLLRRGELEVIGPEGRSTRLTEPSLVFFPRPTSHRLQASEEGGADLICGSVHLGSEYGNPIADGLPAVLILPLVAMPGLESVLQLLFTEAFTEHCGRAAALDRLSELLLIHVLRHALDHNLVQAGVVAGLADVRLAKALQAIHAEPALPWSLEGLAEIAGMSRASFASHFTAVVGTSAGDYLAGWRISIAKSLLARGRLGKTIADEVGYGSANALTRAFTQRIGMTPTQWLSEREQGKEPSAGTVPHCAERYTLPSDVNRRKRTDA